MTKKQIKGFLYSKGIDYEVRVGCNDGGIYLFNLLFDFQEIIIEENKKEIINKIIKKINIEI